MRWPRLKQERSLPPRSECRWLILFKCTASTVACAKAWVEEVTAQLRAVGAREASLLPGPPYFLVGAIGKWAENDFCFWSNPEEEDRCLRFTLVYFPPPPQCADRDLSIKTHCESHGREVLFFSRSIFFQKHWKKIKNIYIYSWRDPQRLGDIMCTICPERVLKFTSSC